MRTLDDLVPLLEAIVSFMDEGVIIADEDGTVLYQNPAAGEMLGAKPNEPIRSLAEAGAVDLEKALKDVRVKSRGSGASGGGFVRFERRVDGAGGRRDLEFHTGLVDAGEGKRRLRVVISQDRTFQRRLEDAMRGANAELQSNDPRMLGIMTRIEQVAPTNAFVLLQGESGTGKTRMARMIHRRSARAAKRFVEINCAAIPENLIESELFGHVKGAFTGATQSRTGRFQAADGGTLFLDEISEIPLHLQAKLLRAVQEQEFEPVGSDAPVKVDVRVIAASNRKLRDMVARGEFRDDLYYRLAVIPLDIPPLRDRPGDIPLLLKHFCADMGSRGYSADVDCNPEAMRMMMDYHWPGNVREMENAVEYSIICAVNNTVIPDSLPPYIRERGPDAPPRPATEQVDGQRAEIESALAAHKGNKAAAARALGVDRTTLWRRMRKLGL